MGIDFGPYFFTYILLLRSLLAGGAGTATAPAIDGTPLGVRVLPGPRGTLQVFASEGSRPEIPYGVVYPAADSAYPSEYPVSDQSPVLVLSRVPGVDEGTILIWLTPREPLRLARTIVQWSERDGWSTSSRTEPTSDAPLGFGALLDRGTVTRMLMTAPADQSNRGSHTVPGGWIVLVVNNPDQ